MGTRCLFKVYDDYGERVVCVIYKHFDGYPEGEPLEVAKFLASRRLQNGIGDDWKVFNGAHDLAAQLVTFLKLRHALITKILESRRRKSKSKTLRISEENIDDAVLAGEVYVLPCNTVDVLQEYEYHIKRDEDKIIIEAYYVKEIGKERLIFKGTAEEFVKEFSR